MECLNSHCFACTVCSCSVLGVHPSEVIARPTLSYIQAIIGCAATSLGDTLRAEQDVNLGTPYFARAALPHYGRHCARVNRNYTIITFLWHKLAYVVIPCHSAGGCPGA